MKRNIILSLIIYLSMSIYQLTQWLGCNQFTGMFHFSYSTFALHSQEYIHNDEGFAVLLTRILHNKISVLFPDILNPYLRFFDFQFLTHFLTTAGVFGLLVGVWYVWEHKQKKLFSIIGLLILCVPLVLIFFYASIPYHLQALLLWITLQVFIIYSIYTFLIKNKRKGLLFFIGILLLNSIWISVFSNQLQMYCMK